MNKKKKKFNPAIIFICVITYLLMAFFVTKTCSYLAAYPKKDFSVVLNIMFSDNLLNFPAEPTNALSIMCVLTFFCLLGVAMIYAKSKSDVHVKQGTEEGTSAWITDKDPNLEKWNKTYSDPAGSPNKNGRKNAIMTQDIYLSLNTNKTRRNLNTLVVGGSGSGKSRFFVKPNLCEMPLNCNFICTDPSGELLAETGSMLEGAGYKIKVFDLVNMAQSDRYNPLKYINCENDVILLVDCILANTTDPRKSGGDDFWEKAQKLMFQAIIFFIWKHGDEFGIEKNMNSVVRLMDGCQISEEESTQKEQGQGGETGLYFAALKTHGWYFDNQHVFHLGKPKGEDESFYEYHPPLPDNGRDDISIKQWDKFMSGAGKTLKSILISAMARLSTLDSSAVADLLATDNIELDKIGDEKTALFVIIPQEHESFNFLAAMLYTQLFQVMYYHAERECQGNYIVEDSNGENVKIFPISHDPKPIVYNNDDIEIDIDFSKLKIEIETETETETESKEKENKTINRNTKEKTTNNGFFSKLFKSFNKNNNNGDNNKNKPDEKPKTIEDVAFSNDFKENKDTRMDESPGKKTDEDVKKLAKSFIERAKNAHCTKKGRMYYIKVPAESGKKEDEEIVGVYSNPVFAQKKLEAIQKGCKISRCGLKLPYHIRFMLDEFANIGRIPDFTKKIATCRKYSISASIILQSISQIKTIYKDDWGTIIGNCDSFLFLGCQEIDTLEYVSKLLGKKTQRKRNESVSKGGKGSTNLSYQYSGRDLMTVDELRRLDNNDCIFVLRGEYPYKGKKHQFVNHENYKYTADADFNNLYTFQPKPLIKEISTNYINPNVESFKFDETNHPFSKDKINAWDEKKKKDKIKEIEKNKNNLFAVNTNFFGAMASSLSTSKQELQNHYTNDDIENSLILEEGKEVGYAIDLLGNMGIIPSELIDTYGESIMISTLKNNNDSNNNFNNNNISEDDGKDNMPESSSIYKFGN